MAFNEDYLCYEQLRADYKVLGKKLENSRKSVAIKNQQLEDYRYTVEKEKHDYDVLEKTSMSQIIAKITGNYEAKLEKEYREYLAAKQHLDELMYQLEYANHEVLRIEAEMNNKSIEAANKLREIKELYKSTGELEQLNAEREKLLCKRKEYEEAIDAVRETLYHAGEVATLLTKAGDAATWDMLGGDFFGDMLKYSALDKVGYAVSAMRNSAYNMKVELDDINISFDVEIDYIDNTTRAFDVFFDNLFTDVHVKDRITNNANIINDYICRLEELECRLTDELRNINSEVEALII